jgi:hypothetical protein
MNDNFSIRRSDPDRGFQPEKERKLKNLLTPGEMAPKSEIEADTANPLSAKEKVKGYYMESAQAETERAEHLKPLSETLVIEGDSSSFKGILGGIFLAFPKTCQLIGLDASLPPTDAIKEKAEHILALFFGVKKT